MERGFKLAPEDMVVLEQLSKLRSARDVPDVQDVAEGMLALAEECGFYDAAWRAWAGDSADGAFMRSKDDLAIETPFVCVLTAPSGETLVGVAEEVVAGENGRPMATVTTVDPSDTGRRKQFFVEASRVTPLACARLDLVWDVYCEAVGLNG